MRLEHEKDEEQNSVMILYDPSPYALEDIKDRLHTLGFETTTAPEPVSDTEWALAFFHLEHPSFTTEEIRNLISGIYLGKLEKYDENQPRDENGRFATSATENHHSDTFEITSGAHRGALGRSLKAGHRGEHLLNTEIVFDKKKPLAHVLMFNPGGDGSKTKVTTEHRKVPGYRGTWGNMLSRVKESGYGGMNVINMFTAVESNMRKFTAMKDKGAIDPTQFLDKKIKHVIVAYGSLGSQLGKNSEFTKRVDDVLEVLKKKNLRILSYGTNSDGSPTHGLRARGSLKPYKHKKLHKK